MNGPFKIIIDAGFLIEDVWTIPVRIRFRDAEPSGDVRREAREALLLDLARLRGRDHLSGRVIIRLAGCEEEFELDEALAYLTR